MKKLFAALLSLLCFVQANSQTLEGNRYHGMVEANFFYGNDGVFKDGNNSLGCSISTTHGYQINPNYFVGMGISWQYHFLAHVPDVKTTPVFVDFRANLNRKRISPFIEAKVGYSVEHTKGVYLAPAAGIRFGLHKNMAFFVSLGYTAQGYKYRKEDIYMGYSHKEIKDFSGYKRSFIHNLAITGGFEF